MKKERHYAHTVAQVLLSQQGRRELGHGSNAVQHREGGGRGVRKPTDIGRKMRSKCLDAVLH